VETFFLYDKDMHIMIGKALNICYMS